MREKRIKRKEEEGDEGKEGEVVLRVQLVHPGCFFINLSFQFNSRSEAQKRGVSLVMKAEGLMMSKKKDFLEFWTKKFV